MVQERLSESPLELTDILRACVEVVGLFEVLTTLGELFGNSGQRRSRKRRR